MAHGAHRGTCLKIAILIEGATETVFIPKVREFLGARIMRNRMPKLDPVAFHGRIPTGAKLRRVVENLLTERDSADAVIALTDVYTGTREFLDADDAKTKMREWVGNEPRFYPHAAQHDFEAWLLPFWADIQRLAGSNRGAPGGNPETVNHNNPPAHRLREVFRTGSKGKAYVKPRDAGRILRDNDLTVTANVCPELKAFLNTILIRCGAAAIE